MHPTHPFSDLGLSAGANSALASVLEILDPGPDPARRVPYAQRRRPEFYVEAEVARALAPVLPALLAGLLGAALRPGPGDPSADPIARERAERERSVAAANARDQIEAAAARGLAAYHRERVRPALLDLAAYLARYDNQCRDPEFPGGPKDWDRVDERIRGRLADAREAIGPLAARPLPEPPKKARKRGGSTEKLLASAGPAFLGASRRIGALALAPPPASPEKAQTLWAAIASEAAPVRAVSRGLAHALAREASTPARRYADAQAA